MAFFFAGDRDRGRHPGMGTARTGTASPHRRAAPRRGRQRSRRLPQPHSTTCPGWNTHAASSWNPCDAIHAAWLVSRTTTTDTHLGTHPVRSGTAVFFSPYLIHHRTDQYDNPEQFDPDRWSSSRHLNPPDGSFIPFGGGARKCVGDQFGITEAVIILATIAARWRLEPLPGRPVRPALALTLSPQRLHMRLRPRT